MSNTQIGIAILGAGLFAREAHLPAIAAVSKSANLRLEAVYSRSKSSAHALAELAANTLSLDSSITSYSDDSEGAGLDDLLARKDISAVIVVLPLVQQPEIVIKALKAGKHVLSEKPVAKDARTAVELIKTYENDYSKSGLVWRVAENFECEVGVQAAAEAIKSGKIGKVVFFRLSAINQLDQESKWYKTPWRTVPDYQGGFLLDGGVHSAALLRTILPDEIISVTGISSLTKDYLAPQDTIQSILQTSGGAHGIFELSFAAPNQSRGESTVIVTGTEGYLQITQEKRPGPDGKETQHYVIKIVDKAGKEDISYHRSQGVEREIEYFAKAINGDKEAIVSGTGGPRGALRDVAVIEASLTSKGQLVDLHKLVT